jgi:tetratricopeptide (TPR) repeat protein
MRMNTWLRFFILAAVFTVAGCNLFNPSGEGDAGDTNPSAEGDEFIRRGQYAKALAAFDRAIRQDSTNSYAYVGYATAAVLLYKLSQIEILNDLQATKEDPTQFAFLKHPDSVLTLRLQAASRVKLVLGRLTDRDTLTRWYRYLTDSTSQTALEDTAYATRRLFIENYLVKADLDSAGYRKRSRFPLTDFRQPYTNVVLDFTAFELLYTITRLYDLDRNDTIDHRDALMKKLNFGGGGGFKIDSLSNIADDLENDSAAAGNLNALIAGMQSGLLGASQLAQLIAPSSSGSGNNENSGNIDSTISSMGDAIMFYQFGDKLDNDGDGCIDEELLDEKDNDLDGYVDEDARVIPADKPDGVDNDRNGKTDPFFSPTNTNLATVDSAEGPVGAAVYPARPHVLGFVYKYMLSNDQNQNELAESDDSKTTWVKIKRNEIDPERLKLRISIQKDSLAVKVARNGGIVPDSLVAKIQNAKNEVGGCWRNY